MIKGQSGQILLLAIVVVGLVTVNTVIMAAGSQTFSQSTNYSLQSEEAINLAEAGLDKAVASLNATGGSYTGDPEVKLENGSFSTIITTPTAGTKVITSTGYIPSKSNPRVQKTITVTAAKGVGLSFTYGVQAGEGGFSMGNNSQINGSVYSNGDINMTNGSRITGDAYVAGAAAPTPDQESLCTSPNCLDYDFGETVNSQNRYDVAQSFQPQNSGYLNKISLNLKKTSSPSDIQVKILGDSSGKPNKNNVLASGTLPASLITNQYSLVDVAFSTLPYLNANTSYWILLDTGSNGSSGGYFTWASDGVSGYTSGSAAWSSNWQAKTPVWNSISSDMDFQVFLGGLPTSIIGTNGAVVDGNAHADVLEDLSVIKGAYYQTKQNVTAGAFYPNSPDPAPIIMPISDGNIQSWKDTAAAAGIYNGDISSCISSFGPGKYVGNVSFDNNCTVTVKDPIWITGNLTLNNGVTLKLDNSYGATSGVIVVDGQILLSNNVTASGTGIAGSSLVLLSTYDSRANGISAITLNNGGNQSFLYAANGIITLNNGNSVKEITGWQIKLNNGVIVNYDTGIASSWFSSGPSGSFSIVKGTYQLK